MSLEAALQANTEAIKALAAIMAGATGRTPIVGADPAVIASAQAASAKNKAPAKTEPPKPAAPAAVTYQQVADPFLELVKLKGRDAALAVIAPLKALNEVKAKEQHAGQYAELLAKIKEALKPAEAASLV